MNDILEQVNNHIDEVLLNPELLEKVCDYLKATFDMSIDNLRANPNVLRIRSFIVSKIQENPEIVLSLPYDLMKDDDSITYLYHGIKEHFVPSFSDIEANPIIGRYLPLGTLERMLKQEPRMILYFPEDLIDDYSSNVDFVATEEELIKYPWLRSLPGVMESSINANHELIKYLNTDIDVFTIDEALSDVQLSREDFLNNSFLCTNEIICRDDYLVYYNYLTNPQKAEIISKYLREGRLDEIVSLPFLQHEFNENIDSEMDVLKVIKLIKSIAPDLSMIFDNNVNDEQWEILNSIFDGIGAYRYRLKKSSFKFKSIDGLVDRFDEYFDNINDNNKNIIIDILVRECMDFMGTKNFDPDGLALTIDLNKIYDIYLKNKNDMSISEEDRKIVSGICNYILNSHRDVFVENEKNKLREIINETFRLKPNIIDQIRMEKKRKKAIELFREEFYQGKHDDEIDQIFRKGSIKREIKKAVSKVTDETFNNIFDNIVAKYIEAGQLEKEELESLLLNYKVVCSPDTLKNIIKLMNKYIIDKAKKVELTKKEEEITVKDRLKRTSPFSPKNLCMTNKGHTDYVLSLLIVELLEDETKIKKIPDNVDDFSILKRIIPFFGLVKNTKELSIEMLEDIIVNLPRINRRLNPDSEKIELSFEKLIGYATDYGKSSDLVRTIISPTVTEAIGEHNVGKYADFYLKYMFDRQESTIPIINGETSKYTFSSRFRDQDRLRIGKMYEDSCIDLTNISGSDTFKECLAGPNGDVILIRDRIDNNLVGRVLAVRRGNLVQLQLRNIDQSISEEEYNTIISLIGNNMLKESISNEDNLDVVVVATDSHSSKKDVRLNTLFPHADWLGYYEVVAEKYKDVQFDFDVEPKHIYTPKRSRIREDASDQKLSAMKAISIKLLPDSIEKEDKERNFEPVIFEGTGNSLLLGDDWYIIHHDGVILEEVVIPTKDIRQLNEITTIKNNLGLKKEDGVNYG